MLCRLAVVAGLAEAASPVGVVGVEPGGDELPQAERVMVGHCGQSQSAEDTDRVAVEDRPAEVFVGGVVAALSCGSPLLLGGLFVVVAAPAGGCRRCASGEGALATQVGHSIISSTRPT
jgi:hypothetical protein